MGIWTADIGNDPYDDYNLIIEVLCDDKDIAVIRNTGGKFVIKWFAHENELDVPVDWLIGLLSAAKDRLESN